MDKIGMYDKNRNLISVFNSTGEATKYLVDIGYVVFGFSIKNILNKEKSLKGFYFKSINKEKQNIFF